MTTSSRTLLIMAGGTGGHIFPGLAIAEEMQRRSWNVEWLGTHAGMENSIVPKAKLRLHRVNFDGVVGKGIGAKLRLPFKLFGALLGANAVMKRVRPNVVLGMGGYPALPGGLVASWTGRPLVTHEQNAVPGQTNRVLAGRAKRVLCAFPGTYKGVTAKATTVGNPVRQDIIAVADAHEAWDGTRPMRIAIVGGSRGAQALNEIVPQAIAKIPTAQRPQLIHQCGKGNTDPVRARYQQLNVAAEVCEFVDDMAGLYRNVDLMICRSGASTVSELACAQLPAIFVPYPYHADQQQLHNARVLTSAGGALLMEQSSMSAEVLAETLMQLSAPQLATMRSILRTNATPNATQDIANIIEELARAQ